MTSLSQLTSQCITSFGQYEGWHSPLAPPDSGTKIPQPTPTEMQGGTGSTPPVAILRVDRLQDALKLSVALPGGELLTNTNTADGHA